MDMCWRFGAGLIYQGRHCGRAGIAEEMPTRVWLPTLTNTAGPFQSQLSQTLGRDDQGGHTIMAVSEGRRIWRKKIQCHTSTALP